jgi:signal transduction histidine kinase
VKRIVFLVLVLVSCVSLAEQKAQLNLDIFSEETSFQGKMKDGQTLVNDAVAFFEKNSLGKTCRAFEGDRRWRVGEFFIFIFDTSGTCYLFGKELLPLWENFTKKEGAQSARGFSPFGQDFIEEMVEVGKKGGWVSYNWSYSTDYSYVKTIEKNGKTYIIGTGFYPESQKFLVQQLVKQAVHLGAKDGAEVLFRDINNPRGRFVQGDFYLWAYDMNGNAFAHGRNLAVIGQNRLDWKDSDGKYRNRIIIDLLKESNFAWINYEENSVLKIAYIERFTDPRTGKSYFVGGGYYPNITDDTVISFVKRGVNYLKSEGPAVAFRDFSSAIGGFEQGPLRMLAFDLDGTVLADAQNPIFIGQNLMQSRDQSGKFMIKEMIETARKDGRGWVTYVDNNAYKNVYVEFVETPDGKYIIGSGFWPSSQANNARSMAEKAVTFMQNNTVAESLRTFIGTSSDFLRGNLFVAVYSDDSVCLAYGTDRERIWADESLVLDEKGYPFIDRTIDMAKRGGGWVEFMRNDRPFRAYASEVKKEIKTIKDDYLVIAEEETIKKGRHTTRKLLPKKSATHESFIITVGYYV